MTKPLAALTALALAASMSFGAATAQAAPVRPAPIVLDGGPVVDVQFRRDRRFRRNRAIRRDFRRTNRRLRRQRNRALAGGIIGGIALGAIIAGSRKSYAQPRYVEPRRVYRQPRYTFSPAHHGWCSHRYRSYRSSDGTFQPYHGPRKLCRSPYL